MTKFVKSGFLTDVNDTEIVEVGGRKLSINSGWYRGNNPRFRPRKMAMLSPHMIEAAILDGWAPSEPVIDKSMRLLAFGSCFAANIAKHLGKAGFNLLGSDGNSDGNSDGDENVYAIACNEGIVNTFTMRQMFEWVCHGKEPNEPLWRKQNRNLYIFSDRHRRESRKLVESADVFVITLGLSEIWYNKESGEVFSSTIPRDKFDPDKHGFRVSTVPENIDNLNAIYGMIRELVPAARIILTLSPIPLMATFRPVSCISANAVSKAILRVAVDELMRRNAADNRLHYWPSYEIVMEGFRDSFLPDNRHVKEPILTFIMTLFEAVYCKDGAIDGDILKAHFDAAVASGEVPQRFAAMVEAGDVGAVSKAAKEIAERNIDLAILLVDRMLLSRDKTTLMHLSNDLRQKQELLERPRPKP